MRAKSTSLTRSRRHSINRMPVPYSRLAISQVRPSIIESSRRTSSIDSTVGSRRGRLARSTEAIHGKSTRSTSRYRNISADSA